MAEIKGSQADIQKVRMLEQERERKKQEVEQRRQAIAKDTGELVSICTSPWERALEWRAPLWSAVPGLTLFLHDSHPSLPPPLSRFLCS